MPQTSSPSTKRKAPAARADATAATTPPLELPAVDRNQELAPDSLELMPGLQHPATEVEELGDSIALFGQLHPGTVFCVADSSYWIVAGRRRWLACQALGRPYRADVYDCRHLDAWAAQDLGRRLRLVENDQRVEPSAYHVALQLRAIRNERGYSTQRELAQALAMPESRVKRYLGIFQGSDRLLDAAQNHPLSVHVLSELVKAEKLLGTVKARKLLKRAVAGEVSSSELKRMRKRARHGKRATQRKDAAGDLGAALRRVIRLVERDPEAVNDVDAGLLADVQARLAEASSEETLS